MHKEYGFKNKRLPTGCLKEISEKTGLPKRQLSGWLGGSRKLYAGIEKTLVKKFGEIGITTTENDWFLRRGKIRTAISKWYKQTN